MARQGKRVRALMLQAALVEISEVIELRMIAGGSVYVSEVEARQISFFESGQIGIVWQQAIELKQQRVCHWSWGTPRKLSYQPTVSRACLKQHRGTAASVGIEVERQPHVFGPGMLVHKTTRTQKPELFAIAEQKDDVIL